MSPYLTCRDDLQAEIVIDRGNNADGEREGRRGEYKSTKSFEGQMSPDLPRPCRLLAGARPDAGTGPDAADRGGRGIARDPTTSDEWQNSAGFSPCGGQCVGGMECQCHCRSELMPMSEGVGGDIGHRGRGLSASTHWGCKCMECRRNVVCRRGSLPGQGDGTERSAANAIRMWRLRSTEKNFAWDLHEYTRFLRKFRQFLVRHPFRSPAVSPPDYFCASHRVPYGPYRMVPHRSSLGPLLLTGGYQM